MPDPIAVNSMFGRIAHRYDLANRVLSGGIDTYWRSRLVDAVEYWRPRNVLDLATGSGDVAFALARKLHPSVRIFGMDFCEPMLERAETRKARRPALYSGVEFIFGDALEIPVAEATFDAVTIAFGLRNLASRPRCLAEIRRVLRPDGHLFVLEFSQPWRLVRPFYSFYLGRVVPRLAGILTGDRRAYEYLGATIDQFPEREALSAEIGEAGYGDVRESAMTMGIVALHSALRQPTVN
ncbi:MAG TPA: bifunctional demethylmenaquinone methyltransferase/2-methoxy-6-polyprenyl-1,4-benzoquinol methylase UbiE [Opitutaceae bacterium]|nr:bifunctional demethylmenaquinone methyltransferase/2-methoxy-6-polyprenyl-1,4-benzoquinol methylase UbiE [Opitutaceae bacterium]